MLENKLQQKKNFFFRVDGGAFEGVGMGHLFRCLRLARRLVQLKIKVIFLSKVNPACEKLILDNGFELYKLNRYNNEREELIFISELISSLNQSNAGIIIDIRGKKKELIDLLLKNKFSTVVYEDFSEEKINPLIIINPNNHNKNNYLNTSTKYYIGDKYRIFDSNIDAHKKNSFQRKIKELFICFGGADPCNLSTIITSLLIKECPDIELRIALGPSSKYFDDLNIQALRPKKIKIFRGENFLPKLMISSDAAITSGGTIMYESVLMRIPVFAIPTSEQELKEVVRYKKIGVIDGLNNYMFNNELTTFKKSVGIFLDSDDKRFNIYNAQKKLSLTNGLDNVIEILKINMVI